MSLLPVCIFALRSLFVLVGFLLENVVHVLRNHYINSPEIYSALAGFTIHSKIEFDFVCLDIPSRMLGGTILLVYICL